MAGAAPRASRCCADASGPTCETREEFSVEWLGTVPFADGLALQRDAVESNRLGRSGDRLLLMEHPAVITLGRSSHCENLLESETRLAARGIEVCSVPRGGDITYHAPGQLVGYLICDLRAKGAPDVHQFLRDIEAALIDALAELGVAAFTIPGKTGVYVSAPASAPAIHRQKFGRNVAGRSLCKIASIGVGVRHWISHQGFALNVDLDLRGFDAIVPCGLRDVVMTSIAASIPAQAPDLPSRTRRVVADCFSRQFGSLDLRSSTGEFRA
jgi:lipoyl(octanoyl) transferase